MKKLLITGASGFLGWHVLKDAPSYWHTIGTYQSNANLLPPRSEAVQLDFTQPDEVWKLLKTIRPTAVFHLAAASSPAFCEANKESSRHLNVNATATLAEMCAERRIKLLFTSSEQVFDGLSAPYTEESLPTPRNEYGAQKLEAEKLVQAVLPEAVIVRLAVLFGRTGSGRNFLEQWEATWLRGDAVTAFYDEIRSFVSGDDVAKGLLLLLEKGAEGLFNLGGADGISRYEFAERASAALCPSAKIERKSQQEVRSVAFRPPNLTLDIGKMRELGFNPSPELLFR